MVFIGIIVGGFLQSSLLARTKHLITLITTAESEVSLLKRIEDFIAFIKQYPEAKHVAVKVNKNVYFSLFFCLQLVNCLFDRKV